MALTPELWVRVCRAFDDAVNMDVSRQAEFLNELRRTDAEAALALEQMLKRRGGSEALKDLPTRLLENYLETETPGPGDPNAAEKYPDHIGLYRITRPLARGGMGVVFLATDEKFQRPVAV